LQIDEHENARIGSERQRVVVDRLKAAEEKNEQKGNGVTLSQ
jgi:hypothetical protein